MKYSWLRVLRTEHIRGGERWGPPHSLPLQYRASTALAGWGHVPNPRPPSAGVTGGAEHTSPPLAVVTGEHRRHRGGPAGREREEQRVGRRRRREYEPGPPGPWSAVVGPRAGRRARARRRRRAQPWRGEGDRTRGERGEGDQGS
jgi:hypothetical protein